MGYYPKINYKALIFCELMIMNNELNIKATHGLVAGAERRRDIWPSKEEAYKALKSRGTWKTWDDRVLRNYVVSFELAIGVDNQLNFFFLGLTLGIWDATSAHS